MTERFGILYTGQDQRDCFRLLEKTGFSQEITGPFVGLFKDVVHTTSPPAHEFEVFVLVDGTPNQVDFKAIAKPSRLVETNVAPIPWKYFDEIAKDEDRGGEFYDYIAETVMSKQKGRRPNKLIPFTY